MEKSPGQRYLDKMRSVECPLSVRNFLPTRLLSVYASVTGFDRLLYTVFGITTFALAREREHLVYPEAEAIPPSPSRDNESRKSSSGTEASGASSGLRTKKIKSD